MSPSSPRDIQVFCIDSLESPLAKLDIGTPIEDVISAVREEDAARVKQITDRSHSRSAPSAEAARSQKGSPDQPINRRLSELAMMAQTQGEN